MAPCTPFCGIWLVGRPHDLHRRNTASQGPAEKRHGAVPEFLGVVNGPEGDDVAAFHKGAPQGHDPFRVGEEGLHHDLSFDNAAPLGSGARLSHLP